jgi:hypothetical protein
MRPGRTGTALAALFLAACSSNPPSPAPLPGIVAPEAAAEEARGPRGLEVRWREVESNATGSSPTPSSRVPRRQPRRADGPFLRSLEDRIRVQTVEPVPAGADEARPARGPLDPSARGDVLLRDTSSRLAADTPSGSAPPPSTLRQSSQGAPEVRRRVAGLVGELPESRGTARPRSSGRPPSTTKPGSSGPVCAGPGIAGARRPRRATPRPSSAARSAIRTPRSEDRLRALADLGDASAVQPDPRARAGGGDRGFRRSAPAGGPPRAHESPARPRSGEWWKLWEGGKCPRAGSPLIRTRPSRRVDRDGHGRSPDAGTRQPLKPRSRRGPALSTLCFRIPLAREDLCAACFERRDPSLEIFCWSTRRQIAARARPADPREPLPPPGGGRRRRSRAPVRDRPAFDAEAPPGSSGSSAIRADAVLKRPRRTNWRASLRLRSRGWMLQDDLIGIFEGSEVRGPARPHPPPPRRARTRAG